MRRRLIAVPVALALGLAAVPPAARAQTAAQNRRVANGEVVTWIEDTGSPIKTCVAIGLVDAPPDRVYKAMVDFSNYPKVFRLLSSSTILRQSGNEIDVRHTMTPPWPFTERIITTRTVMDPAHYTISYRAIDGNVKTYEGSMNAFPWGKGKTKFTYRTKVDPGIPLLPSWAITWGTRTSLPSVVRDLGNYVRRLR